MPNGNGPIDLIDLRKMSFCIYRSRKNHGCARDLLGRDRDETSRQEMCMGMGFPVGMEIPWEYRGNGIKTRNLEWK